MASLAGDDDHPAVPGFDPDVSAELYTTNGDVTDDAYQAFGTLAYTVELDGGTGPAVGGTDGTDPDAYTPGGFVFQDTRGRHRRPSSRRTSPSPSTWAARPTTRRTSSRTWATPRRDLVPTTFPISYGDPQTVEVNAKRELGAVTLHWRVNGGREHRAATHGVRAAASRYGEPGVYYHRCAAT